MKQKLFFILFLFFYCFFSEAQDIHFTQYYTSPLNLNPATTGFFNGTERFALQNKTQWQSVTVPFTTLSASFDMPIWKRYIKHDIFGGGIVINRDQEGDSKFGTTQVNLSFSYIRSLSRLNNQFISIGIQAGAAQRSIDYTQLVFDNQWDGSSFNSALPNDEHFAKSNFIYFDCSAGAYWSYLDHYKNEINAGIALSHINAPEQSLFDNSDVRLARKLLVHASMQYNATNKFKLVPGILFMKQGTYYETDIGSLVKFIKMSTAEKYLALSVGLYYRYADAFNIIAGLDFKDISLGISYDVNTSNLVPASHSRGGLEISLVYILNKNQKVYVKKIPCPIF
jgi:type IX secretion system PorP/SprF family membrane protein